MRKLLDALCFGFIQFFQFLLLKPDFEVLNLNIHSAIFLFVKTHHIGGCYSEKCYAQQIQMWPEKKIAKVLYTIEFYRSNQLV